MLAPQPIRVLIVEDSRLHASLLRQALEPYSDICVLDVARDGHDAIHRVAELRPDLITMDVRLPYMDGQEATQAIMATHPTPILVVAELSSRYDTTAQRMLGAGALDILPKPHGLSEWAGMGERLAQRIRVLWRVKVGSRPAPAHVRMATPLEGSPCEVMRVPLIVAIVASTGGPHTLLRILAKLPAAYSIPVVFVQHIARGFGPGLAHWLGQNCALPVSLVEKETALAAPGIFMAPDDRHLVVAAPDRLVVSYEEPIASLRPRGDLLLSSAARVFGARGVGIVLTGMGDDGARGLQDMRHSGALTIAQDEASSTIYGMPKVAFELGAAAQVLSPEEIAARLLTWRL